MPSMSFLAEDELFMMECLALARKGTGHVSPNPRVGAVIVRRGEVLGRGYHQRFGGPHAEVEAIRASKRPVHGATLYVNLEPCNIFGKTPPCADLLIELGIKRVVVGMRDPNPRVSGRGITRLRKAGLTVDVGVLMEECQAFNESFTKHVTTGYPFVTLKVAQTLDGMIADTSGRSRWISSAASRTIVHQLRSEADAVLVGAGTIAADNPKLTVRMVKGRSPLRVVLDGRLSTNVDARIFMRALASNTVVITSSRMSSKQKMKKALLQSRGVEIIELAADRNQFFSLSAVLKALGERGIASVLVEGGSEVFSRFIAEKCADRLLVFIAPFVYGSGLPAFSRLTSRQPLNLLRPISTYSVGKDALLDFRLKSK